METKIQLVEPIYSCQGVPVVVFGKRCPQPCLYCGLQKYQFPEEKVIASGIDNVLKALLNYKSAYFSPVTDCFLTENNELTHYLLEETWKNNSLFTPLVITKQIIPQKTIDLFVQNKDRLVLQISVPSINEKIISILEPGSAPVMERLKMIKKLTISDIPVIAVAMPWFPFKISGTTAHLSKALANVGIKRVIVATGVLSEEQRKKMIHSGNREIKIAAEWTNMNDKDGATKKGYTFSLGWRLSFLREAVDYFNLFGIKATICTSDNYDLIGQTSLPLCQQFKHHNFKEKEEM